MKRNRIIAVVSHCILNQNSVVYDLARSGGALKELVKYLIDNDYAIYQLPCPELIYAGIARSQKSYEQYSTPEFIAVCREAASTIAKDLRDFISDGCIVETIIGINNSPSCSVNCKQGHFIEALKNELPELATAEWTDVPKNYDGSQQPWWL
ncbi:MAG: CD3072 family TudS-related putative desulfidase [Negativicutes bacterium]